MIQVRDNKGRFKPLIMIILVVFPILMALICLRLGRMDISMAETFDLFESLIKNRAYDQSTYAVIINIRLPRTILALLVGSGMAVAGICFQSLFSNPMATPDILGVTSASCLGAIIAILLGQNLVLTQVMAFIFGLFAVFLSLTLASGRKSSIISMILTGLVIGSVFDAISSLLKYTADPTDKLPQITYWLMGSFSSASYENISLGGPIILTGILMVYLMRWRLNLMALSEDEAMSMGIDLKKTRLYFIIASTIITAAVVSMCGQIGWIGLVIPHISRLLVGANNSNIVPVSLSLGAGFMVIVETLSRTLSIIELPLSVLTALIGAPIFIILLRRSSY